MVRVFELWLASRPWQIWALLGADDSAKLAGSRRTAALFHEREADLGRKEKRLALTSSSPSSNKYLLPLVLSAKRPLDRIAAAYRSGSVIDMREYPPQMQSPTMNSQGFTDLPLVVASLRHVTVTYAGLSLPASGSCCRKFLDWSALHSQLHPTTCDPRRDSRGATRVTPLLVCQVPRLGTILKLVVEGGRRPFASGTPAIRGAHNSETLRQQPDHCWLV